MQMQMQMQTQTQTQTQTHTDSVNEALVYNDKTVSMRKEFLYSVDKANWSAHYRHFNGN